LLSQSSDAKLAYHLMVASSKEGEMDFSYIFLGARNSVTFFYPQYRVLRTSVFHASIERAALHYLSHRMIAEMNGQEISLFQGETVNPIIRFLPALLKLMFVANVAVQTEATVVCASVMGSLPRDQTVAMVRDMTFNRESEADVFFLGMATVHSNFLQSHERRELLSFLCEKAAADHPSASLAIIILLAAGDFWSELLGSKPKLLAFIFKLVLRKSFMPTAINFFHVFACRSFSAFVEGAQLVIAETRDREIAREIFNCITILSLQHGPIIGSNGALAVASLASHFPAFAEVAEASLKVHDSILPTMVRYDKTIVIGGTDGILSIFQRGKILLQKKIFEGPIAMVSIDPSGRACAVLCIATKELKRFDIPRNGPLAEPVLVARDLDLSKGSVSIEWTGHVCRVAVNRLTR
jgi:hypothetical protein